MIKRRRVRRFKSISFKFTVQQKKKVDAYCRKHSTTPIRMYKKAIMLYLSNNGYGDKYLFEADPPSNQLSIFDIISETDYPSEKSIREVTIT